MPGVAGFTNMFGRWTVHLDRRIDRDGYMLALEGPLAFPDSEPYPHVVPDALRLTSAHEGVHVRTVEEAENTLYPVFVGSIPIALLRSIWPRSEEPTGEVRQETVRSLVDEYRREAVVAIATAPGQDGWVPMSRELLERTRQAVGLPFAESIDVAVATAHARAGNPVVAPTEYWAKRHTELCLERDALQAKLAKITAQIGEPTRDEPLVYKRVRAILRDEDPDRAHGRRRRRRANV